MSTYDDLLRLMPPMMPGAKPGQRFNGEFWESQPTMADILREQLRRMPREPVAPWDYRHLLKKRV